MVFIKDVSGNADAGTASKWGGNDINFLDDYFDNVDITPKAPKINTNTSYRSGRFRLMNLADTFAYIFITSAITANRNITVPQLSSDATLAFMDIDNLFTVQQTLKFSAGGGNEDMFTLFRNTSTVGRTWEINFDALDSGAAQQAYAALRAGIDTSTAGSEIGTLEFRQTIAGSEATTARLTPTGTFRCGGTNSRIEFADTGLTGQRTFTFPDNTTKLAGLNINANQTFIDLQIIRRPTGQSEALHLFREDNAVSTQISLLFRMYDSATNNQTYGQILAEILDATDGSEDGMLKFATPENGTIATRMQITNQGQTEIRASTNQDIPLKLFTDRSSGSCKMFFDMRDSAANQETYGVLSSNITDATNGSEDADFVFETKIAGSFVTVYKMGIENLSFSRLTIQKDQEDLFKIYRDSNTAANKWGVEFNAKDSGNAEQDYAEIKAEIDVNTAGSEDGKLKFFTVKSGAMTMMSYITKNDFAISQTGSNFVILRNTKQSADRAFDFPDVSGSAGDNARIKVQTHDYFEVEDEFTCGSISLTNTSNAIGNLCWGISNTTGGTPVVTAGVANHPGIVTITTGAASGNNCRIHLTDAEATAFMIPTDLERMAWIVRIPTITTILVRIGLMQSINTAAGGTAGAFFEFDPATSANWRMITRQASTSTANNATTVTANNWYLLEVYYNGTDWLFYINNALQFTHTTNKPTTACNIGAITQTVTTAARPLDIDYFKLRTKKLGQRWT